MQQPFPAALALALAMACALPYNAIAQASPTEPTPGSAAAPGFVLCTLVDSGRTPVQVWASPVFEYDLAASGSDALDWLAREFLRHAATQGGAGTKNCVALPTRAEAEALREKQRALWDKRVYMMKVGQWHDLAWTPPPRAAAMADAPAASRYFRCYATRTEIPGRFAGAWTVSSGVFEMPVPGNDTLAAMRQSNAYAQEFQQVAQAHDVAGQPVLCLPYDTRAEADKAEQDYRRMFTGLLGGPASRYTVVPWRPSGVATAAIVPQAPAVGVGDAPPQAGAIGARLGGVSAELAQALGLAGRDGAWVIEVVGDGAAHAAGLQPMDVVQEIAGQAVMAPADVAVILARLRSGFEAPVRIWRQRRQQELTLVVPARAAPVVPVSSASTPIAGPGSDGVASPPKARAATDALYCFGEVTRSKPLVWARTAIREQPASTRTTLDVTLRQLFAAATAAYPGKWHDVAPQCFDAAQGVPGEILCAANNYGTFAGAQSVALWCNASRETLEARYRQLGSGATQLAWPPGS